MGEKPQRRDWAQWVRAMVEEAKRKRPGQVGLRPVPAWKATGKTAATPDDETQRRRTTMKKETQRQHWTQEEVKAAIEKALEDEPEGPNKDYWASDLTVDAVKKKYRTTKFKPSPLTVVLVRPCCGEKFVHVLANKRQARGLDDWRCPGLECRLRSTTLPFGKFEGQTLSWVYEQEPSYLAWFHETVDGCEDVKEAIRGLPGIEAHLAAFRERRQPSLTPTQQQVEWLMGKFSAETVDKVCEELFGGE